MNPVPIQVVGDGQLAAWHRDVFARHAACALLEQGLPDRTGVVDLCGPASTCSDTMGLCVRQRVPVCLTVPTQWPTSDLARLQQAGAKRRLPMVALGSLRALPAVARLKEIASGRTLGTLRSLALTRRGLDLGLTGNEPDADLTGWRDADLCRWIVVNDPDCAVSVDITGSTAPAEREIRLVGEAGQLRIRFVLGQTPEMEATVGGRTSPRRVPKLDANSLHLAELHLLVSARVHDRPWLLLPSLADVVEALRDERFRR